MTVLLTTSRFQLYAESRARQAGTAEVEVFDEGCLKGMCFFFLTV